MLPMKMILLFCVKSIGINRKMLYAVLVVNLLTVFVKHAMAQDQHFTMFNSSPLFLNPANTGHFIGDWRLAGNYRNQWSAIAEPFQTAAISYDQHFYLLNQEIGGGAMLMTDQTGSNGLNFFKFYGSLAYSTFLNNNFLSAGFQLGYVHGGYKGDQTSPSQWNPATGTFDPDLDNLESFSGNTLSYLDVNFGVLWKRNINIFEPEVGLSLIHLNYPKQSFYDTKEHLPLRIVLHGNVKTKLSDDIYILPSFLYTQHDKATESIIGSNFGLRLFGNKSAVKELIAGVYLKNGLTAEMDAISVTAGALVGRIEINICYDLNISGLSVVTNKRGAFEIAFVYKSISTVLNSYSIPCDRF